MSVQQEKELKRAAAGDYRDNVPVCVCDTSKPYIFISYCHEDQDAVYEVIRELYARGYNVWFDGGIESGKVWKKKIIDCINGAAFFLPFFSAASFASEYCMKELDYAIGKKIPVHPILLYEDVKIPDSIEFDLQSVQAVNRYEYSSLDAFLKKLLSNADLEVTRCIEPLRPQNETPTEQQEIPAFSEEKAEAPSVPNKKKNYLYLAVTAVCVAIVAVVALVIVVIFSGEDSPEKEDHGDTVLTMEAETELSNAEKEENDAGKTVISLDRPNDSRQTAYPIKVGGTYQDFLTKKNPKKWYQLKTDDKDALYRITVSPSKSLDETVTEGNRSVYTYSYLELTVVDVRGAKHGEFRLYSDEGDDYADLYLPANTEYDLQILYDGYFGNPIEFDLRVKKLQSNPGIEQKKATPLSIGQKTKGVFDSNFPSWYRVKVQKSGKYKVTVQNLEIEENLLYYVRFDEQSKGGTVNPFTSEECVVFAEANDEIYIELIPNFTKKSATGGYYVLVEKM